MGGRRQSWPHQHHHTRPPPDPCCASGRQVWPHSVEVWLKPVRIWPNPTRLGPGLARIWPTFRISASSGQSAPQPDSSWRAPPTGLFLAQFHTTFRNGLAPKGLSFDDVPQVRLPRHGDGLANRGPKKRVETEFRTAPRCALRGDPGGTPCLRVRIRADPDIARGNTTMLRAGSWSRSWP